MNTDRRQFLKLLGATGLAISQSAVAALPKEIERKIVEYELPIGIGNTSEFLINLEETVHWTQTVDNNISYVQALGAKPQRLLGRIEEDMQICISADPSMLHFLNDKFAQSRKVTVVSDRLGIKRNGEVKEIVVNAHHEWGRGVEEQGMVTHVEVDIVLKLSAIRIQAED